MLLVILAIAGCQRRKGAEVEDVNKQIEEVASKMRLGKMDTAAIRKMVNDCEAFANKYPADTTSAEFLCKAAEGYTLLHRPLKSIDLYSRVYHNYPNFHRRTYALFMEGFVYETEVNNMEAARITYEEFIKLYPNDVLTPSAQKSLQTLGKSPDELVKEFEQRAQGDSASGAMK